MFWIYLLPHIGAKRLGWETLIVCTGAVAAEEGPQMRPRDTGFTDALITDTGYDWAPTPCNSFILDCFTLNVLRPLLCFYQNIYLSYTDLHNPRTVANSRCPGRAFCGMSAGGLVEKNNTFAHGWVGGCVCLRSYCGASCKFWIAAYISCSWINVAGLFTAMSEAWLTKDVTHLYI